MMEFEIRPCERCMHPADVDPSTEEHLCDDCKQNGLQILDSRNLDATKWMAHAVRENGRYGSHASHDRFDGDAEP